MTLIKTPKQKADELMGFILKGSEVHHLFGDSMRKQLLLSGQPIAHWEQKFRMTIPVDNLTPSLCKELDMTLMAHNQEATFHYAVASVKSQMIKRGTDAAFTAKFWQLVTEHKEKNIKLPAAATLENMAKVDSSELESAATLAEIETKFWKDILEHLNTCRKLIENASLNISVELKAMSNEKMLDRLNSR